MRIIKSIFRWFSIGRRMWTASKRTAEIDYRIYMLTQEKLKSDKDLEKMQLKLDKTQEEHRERCKKLRESVESAKNVNKRMESALQATREQLINVEEIVVTGLVAANKTLTDARDAQSAMYAMQAGQMKHVDNQGEV